MTPSALRPTWCEIDLGAVSHNLRQLRSLVGTDVAIYVCLKGDASGCGAVEIARRAETEGADGFAFGNVDSALACRAAGITAPILLYPTCLPESASALERAGLMPTLSTLEDVALWDKAVHGELPVFLKLDGGGFRAGAFPHEAAALAQAIASSRHLRLAGVYGHPMTSYGFEDEPYTVAQLEGIRAALAAIEATGIPVPLRMTSSSAIVLGHPEADLNAVDPGRLVLGMPFEAIAPRQSEWRPALVGLKSRLVMVRSLAEPGNVQPAPFLSLRPGMRLGLIPLGWSDGFPRKMPEQAFALLRGRRVPLLGPTHSELLRVDLTDVPEAEVGDEVVLLGRSGAAEISLEALADQWRVSTHDLYPAIGKSLPRRYIG
ncbi:alanine racemase [Azorhizobium oxalatiphilum]|uniref:alanine racemase n=1 Tax=Azorhizobium oxalatiphilum TaxID=980631 RepID=A0A917FBP4_9HYPH|nr:alanine racemase [Azorhizobium oxalatiphilum]GGF68065.1 alanine racemase [Azorhizobium oxalatiphilum]